jgi:hypothetical protein
MPESPATPASHGQAGRSDVQDVGLDDQLWHSSAVEPATPIYSHGYSLRLKLVASPQAIEEGLATIGFDRPGRWIRAKTKHAERWIMRGSTFLSGRPPTLGKAIGKLNQAQRTRLYSLQVERTAKAAYLDVHGVRLDDIDKLAAAMGLGPAQYSVLHYRRLERYVVLAPHEAKRLGQALGGREQWGRGRATRKQYLLKDHAVPVVLGRRRRRTARLTIYRVGRGGATAAYKVEVVLQGRTRDRSQFDMTDAAQLDHILLRLVAQHDLRVVTKPERWEPRGSPLSVRDGILEMLPADAYRGRKRPGEALARLVLKCHTPRAAALGFSPIGSIACVVPSYIRPRNPSLVPESRAPERLLAANELCVAMAEDFVEEIEPACSALIKAPRSRGSQHYRAIVEDILKYEGYLSEVILDPNTDPALFIKSFLAAAPAGSTGVMALADAYAGTWGSLAPLIEAHPGADGDGTLLVVVDPEVVHSVLDAVVQSPDPERPWELRQGPLATMYPDPVPRAVSGLLWPLAERLRGMCESNGLRVVLISADARPDHGRGELRRSHFFRDGRVRSSLGDAARYWCHCRYLVEERWSDSDDHWPRRAVMLKDEAEGMMGRVLSS